MNRWTRHLPTAITVALCVALLIYGPIAQPDHYHAFADQSFVFGIPHAQDVLSNLGFAAVAIWGWLRLAPMRQQPALATSWPGHALFLTSLLLTAAGSACYHWEPDNARLIWDRLPIAMACAGVLVAVRADTRGRSASAAELCLFVIAAIASVAWWAHTDRQGEGDLRPYLLLQALPIILVPLWQAIHESPPNERRSYGCALSLYLVAKAAELLDHQLLDRLGAVSGHTLKHLIAALAAMVIVACLVRRIAPAQSGQAISATP